MLIGALLNLFGNIAAILIIPLVLSFATADSLGIVLAVVASGALVSGGIMGIWGGPRRLIPGMVAFLALNGVGLLLAGWTPLVTAVAAGHFLATFGGATAGALMTAIEQRKIAPAMQGRVFGVEGMIALLFEAVAYPSAGLLADRVFEPFMAAGGAAPQLLGKVIGFGHGRGMGLLTLVMGGCLLATAFVSYLIPKIRHLEAELSDALL